MLVGVKRSSLLIERESYTFKSLMLLKLLLYAYMQMLTADKMIYLKCKLHILKFNVLKTFCYFLTMQVLTADKTI